MRSLIRSVVLAVVAVLLLVAATAFFGLPSPSGANKQSVEQTDYKNVAYSIEGIPVTLVNGRAEEASAPGSSSKMVTQFFGNEAMGDLNADGLPDVAFVLTQNGGGSGTFYYIVVALKTVTSYQGTNAIFLGDRIAPQSTEIRGGQLIVNYVDRNPGEPMTTQPSVGVSKYVKLVAGKLVEVTPLPAPGGADTGILILHVGESGTSRGATITPLEVLEDSRCPSDVQCIWAGRVRLRTQLKSGLGTSEQVFEIGTPITTEAETITLTEVSPAPNTQVKFSPSDYRFTFSVEKK